MPRGLSALGGLRFGRLLLAGEHVVDLCAPVQGRRLSPSGSRLMVDEARSVLCVALPTGARRARGRMMTARRNDDVAAMETVIAKPGATLAPSGS